LPKSSKDNPRRFYGRRAGHKLHASQSALVETLLPKLRIDPHQTIKNVRSLFPNDVNEVWLEIGFGAGEHLLWQARENPETGFLASEPYINGVAKVLAAIDRDKIGNIRLYDDDVHHLFGSLPDDFLSRVFILFPDPWPKKRHNKRRIISKFLIDHLARLMGPGAELRFASDIPDYVDWTLRYMQKSPAFAWTARTPDDWRRRPPDWPETRYEKKAIEAGRTAAYLSFRRI
jgi:tRNA (guanine-N7-)-methyltransferase